MSGLIMGRMLIIFLVLLLVLSTMNERFAFSVKIDHFTVVYSVTRPMNGSEDAGDLVLIQITLFLSYKSCCCDPNLSLYLHKKFVTKQAGQRQPRCHSLSGSMSNNRYMVYFVNDRAFTLCRLRLIDRRQTNKLNQN